MTVSIDPAALHRAELDNGLTVLVYRNAAAPVVAINTYVRAGYFDETDDVVDAARRSRGDDRADVVVYRPERAWPVAVDAGGPACVDAADDADGVCNECDGKAV